MGVAVGEEEGGNLVRERFWEEGVNENKRGKGSGILENPVFTDCYLPKHRSVTL